MSLIIAATDFSDVGLNAVRYACDLAREQEASLTIIHSFTVPLTFSDSPIPVNFVNDTEQDARARMEGLLLEIGKSHPGLDVDSEVLFGDILDGIEDYVEEHEKPWMIVVGNSTTGEGGAWPGSTVIEAFHNLRYPVLAVPPGTDYRPVSNICFAFDNRHHGNISAMLRIADIKQRLNADLHVLNAQTEGEVLKEEDIDPIVRNLLSPENPHYTVVTDTDIDHAIEAFIQKCNADMLIMIPRRYSFFEGLFHKSHTKAVAHRSSIPILALPDSHA